MAAAPVDDATKAIIEAAMAAADRGEVFTEDEVEAEMDEAHQEWLEGQVVALPR